MPTPAAKLRNDPHLITVAVVSTCVAALVAGHLIIDPFPSGPLCLGLRLGSSVKVICCGCGCGLTQLLSNSVFQFGKYTSGSNFYYPPTPPAKGLVNDENVLNGDTTFPIHKNMTIGIHNHDPGKWEAIRVREIDPKGFFHLSDDGVLRSFDRNMNVVAYRRLSPAEIRRDIVRFVETVGNRNMRRGAENQDFHEGASFKYLAEVYDGVDGRDVTDEMDLWYLPGGVRWEDGEGEYHRFRSWEKSDIPISLGPNYHHHRHPPTPLSPSPPQVPPCLEVRMECEHNENCADQPGCEYCGGRTTFRIDSVSRLVELDGDDARWNEHRGREDSTVSSGMRSRKLYRFLMRAALHSVYEGQGSTLDFPFLGEEVL